ncbi:MAG TPA: replicative DNA helicase [Sedimentisphaerales bacterium]|nr:replicative DNA helicase [Sedimentisphaerales bacterium]
MSKKDVTMPLRELPQSIAAEAAVLGSIIIDPACLAEAAEILCVEAFYHFENLAIYEALLRISNRGDGKSIDCVLLRDELVTMGKMEEVGIEHIAKIMDTVPSAANAIYYAKIVREKYLLRKLIAACRDICDRAFEQGETVDELIDMAEASIFAIGRQTQVSTMHELSELMPLAFRAIEMRDPNGLTGLSTGFYQLDEITCGLQKGDVIVMAARPSIGKTSLALNIIENLLIGEDVPVALFSLEMGGVQLAERMMSSLSRLENQKVRRNHLNDKDYAELADDMGRLVERRLWIEEASVLTPLSIRSRARRLKAAYDIQCIVIDYLQLIITHGRHENRQQEITRISRSIKSLAKELDVPVILLSQLNRAPASRSNFMPRLTDLRESGSIEQDADVVLLLHREDYYHKGQADYSNTNVADVIIAKQRNGPTGAIKLTFRPELSRFESYAPSEQ